MKLYYAPGTCALAPHIVAREAGLPVELVKVDLAAKKTEHGDDYWRINPKGYVPALVLDDGTLLTEAAVVCQYLADQKPEAGLVSAFGGTARYQEMAMLNFASSEVHKQIGALFNPKMTAEMKTVQMGNIEKRLNTLDKLLEGHDYAMGARFSVADAYLFTVLSWTRHFNIDLAPWPHVLAFMGRVGARDKVQQAMREEGLLG
jgi:glutathione S-transferase